MAMSGPALAKRLGLSRQYVQQAEQGRYSSLNPALLKWVANAKSISTRSVEKHYEKFQKERRRATVERVAPHKLTRRDGSPGAVLFEHWRSGYWVSTTAFSVDFCIHPDLIQKYEEGITKTMPRLLREILTEHNLMDENWIDDPSGASLSAPL
jgi:transcriptional regulator with XRE-family HTH domain